MLYHRPVRIIAAKRGRMTGTDAVEVHAAKMAESMEKIQKFFLTLRSEKLDFKRQRLKIEKEKLCWIQFEAMFKEKSSASLKEKQEATKFTKKRFFERLEETNLSKLTKVGWERFC